MINKGLKIVLGLIISSMVIGQPNHDARMLGLSGAYTILAKGYHSVGVNPANLGSYNNKSANILNISMGLSTNSLSISNYNAINGANLEDPTAINAYPGGKTEFYNSFGGEGIRIMQSLQMPLPMLNFSTQRFASTANLITNIDMGIPNGLLDLLLYGNTFGKNMSISSIVLI